MATSTKRVDIHLTMDEVIKLVTDKARAENASDLSGLEYRFMEMTTNGMTFRPASLDVTLTFELVPPAEPAPDAPPIS